ncbi:MAG: SDR family NAD(P)-dependent oxidoreductase, partial [Chamaesiphon sp.]|nr:SDR family NAD(P)-dependent oxidoreductase [Chamaesiphon sp.]
MSNSFLKAALIVGGGQGIGLGFVRQLLDQSGVQRVYATYRRVESATELLAIDDPKLHCLQMDITDESQIAGVIQAIQVETKTLHYVINSVGVLHEGEMQPEKSLRQINSDQL